ncbi:MAG TPA: PDZ domain-containing protein [Gemmatimonadaceae bacterium]|nr:PDZ domain-containing protein [Gemmatimonadaceae bacterium]
MRRTMTRRLPGLLLLLGGLATITVSTTAGAQEKSDKGKKTDKSARSDDRASGNRRDVWVYRNALDEGRDRDRAVIGIGTAGSAGKRDTLGVLVESVWTDGPADKAGVEEGDRIAAINGVSLRLPAEDAGEPDVGGLMTRRLQRELAKVKAGDAVELSLWKGGQSKVVRVKTVDADSLRSLAKVARDDRDEEEVRAARRDRAVLGLTVNASGSRRDTLGALVTSLATDGPAEKAGLVEGDRIAAINGVDLRTASEDAGDQWASGVKLNRFYREMHKVKAGQTVELRVFSAGQPRTVRITAGKAGDVYKESGKRGMRGFFGGGGDGDWGGFEPMIAPVPPVPPMAPMPGRVPMSMSFDGGDFTLVAPRIAEELRAKLRALDLSDRDVVRLRTTTPRALRIGGDDMADDDGMQTTVTRRGGGRMNMSLSGSGGTLALPGLRLTRVNGDLASYFGAGSEGGLLVTSVSGSSWDGLREGDVIVKVNGDAVSAGRRSRLDIDTREKNELEVIRKGKREKVSLPAQ